MSDRPQGSVRTGVPSADGAAGGAAAADKGAPTNSAPTNSAPTNSAPVDAAAGEQAIPTSGTQAIPTTGAQRAAGGPAPAAPAPAAPAPAAPAPAAPAAGPGKAGAARSRPGRTATRGPRRARLQLRHIDTWSALKISLVLSVALFFIWMVAVGVLYGVLNALGVFDTLNELFGQLGTESGTQEGSDVLTPGVVFGGAAIIGAINIVLLTALCTVGTFIYNMCSDLVGGLELTLSERD